jgi:16S rRNA (adenine1518-N6/adenine1519-N6)-dimethyltransferase
MGQNFLIDLNLHELIVEEARVGSDDVILEIGPGAGALTALMAGRGAMIVAVELDPEMAKLTQEAVAGFPGARVLNIDALANKNTLSPLMIESVDQALDSFPSRVFKLVANLPYSVATPVIMNLVTHPRLCPALMVVTIQRELGERMIALPATPGYGSLSVIIQALAEISIVRVLPPSVFWPRPKVESTIVAIRPDPARRAALDVPWFHELVRKLFLHRRKNLRHVLFDLWPGQWTKAGAEAWLETLGIDGGLRAEALSVEQFRTLAHALRYRVNDARA